MSAGTRYPPERYVCDDGHILYSDNVWITANGFFLCKACDQIRRDSPKRREQIREADRRYKERRREQAS